MKRLLLFRHKDKKCKIAAHNERRFKIDAYICIKTKIKDRYDRVKKHNRHVYGRLVIA